MENVSAVPNAAIVRGKIIKIRSSENGGHLVDLMPQASEDVDGMPNFLNSFLGKQIEIFVNPRCSIEAAEEDMITAKVSYVGDERGSRFVLKQRKLERNSSSV